MAYTASKLITRAYYLSGIVPADYATVSGDQSAAGLDLLNELLSMKTAAQSLIPYFKEHTFSAEVGEQKYFIENCVEIETFNFNMNNAVRFPTMMQSRRKFFGDGRPLGVNSLPGIWHSERVKGGMDLYVFFKPNQAYPFVIWGKFSLDDVTQDTDLEEVYDQYYIGYLRYALAEYICSENGVTYPMQAAKKLEEYEDTIRYISPLDLTQTKQSSLGQPSPYNWAFINLANGYVAPS